MTFMTKPFVFSTLALMTLTACSQSASQKQVSEQTSEQTSKQESLPESEQSESGHFESRQSTEATQPLEQTTHANNTYQGTASVTQGLATTQIDNIYECSRGRLAGIGTITGLDGHTWTVPAVTNFQNADFPVAPDLYNPCNDNEYNTVADALASLDNSDMVEVDADGELYTAYIFADNYFEMYVNGVAVGRDAVPFTQFNSSVVRFKAKRPFSLAMKLVDWEENLGIGSEKGRGSAYSIGDGGMVAVIKDEQGHIIAKTDDDWKAQTFYTAPIKDLTCVGESGTLRDSSNCETSASSDGSNHYALHWQLPEGWQNTNFDDSAWQNATIL